MKFKGVLKAIGHGTCVLIEDITYLAGKFRNHTWIQPKESKLLLSMYEQKQYPIDIEFEGTPYAYQDKLGIKDITMKYELTNITIARKIGALNITFNIPTKYSLKKIEDDIIDILDENKEDERIKSTEYIINHRKATIFFFCINKNAAEDIKTLLKKDSESNPDISFLRVNKLEAALQDMMYGEYIREATIQVKLPKYIHKLFRTFPHVARVSHRLNNEIVVNINKSSISMDGQQLKVSIYNRKEEGEHALYKGTEEVSLDSRLYEEIVMIKRATYNTEKVLDRDNMISLSEEGITSSIDGKSILVSMDMIKKHGQVFTAEYMSEGIFYDIADEDKTPIPAEILDIKSVRSGK